MHTTFVFDHATRHDWLTEMAHLAAQGTVTLRVNRVLPAEEATRAQELLAEGGHRGRMVLDFT